MIEDLTDLAARWIKRGEHPVNGVFVFAYGAMMLVKTSPPSTAGEAAQALEDGLREGAAE